MAANWTLRDLTEFDLLIQRDVRGPASPSKRSLDVNAPRADVLHAWLLETRPLYPEVSRIAETTVRSEAFLRLALCLFGFLSGLGIASALLHYEGTRLINIGVFLGVVVGGQLLLLFAMGLGQLVSRKPVALVDRWLLPESIKRLPALHALSAWGWRLFTTLQISALFLNLGIILGSFWNVLTRDLGFGWATTLQTDGETIHRLVSLLSAPWGGGWAPSIADIEASRIRMSQGISDLPAGATASWWPFLLLCTLVYGILPRLLLAFAGQWKFNALLGRPRFDTTASRRLHQRLIRDPLRLNEDAPTTSGFSDVQADLPPLTPTGPLWMDVESEVLSPDQQKALQSALQTSASLQFISERDQSDGCLRIQEAWMPPLEEHLQTLRDLRSSLEPQADLLILLVGEPGASGALPLPASPEDVTVWSQRLRELNDPHLGVLAWPGGDA